MAGPEEPVKFIALLSAMCGHYHWPHNFWRTMGRNEFYAWVDQLSSELTKREPSPESWDGTENDPGWKAMRAKREKLRGR